MIGRRWPRWTIARRSCATAFTALFVAATLGTLPWFRGTLNMTETGGVLPLVDPLVALEHLLAAREVTTTILIGAGLLLGVAVVLGPVFCAWVCPLGLVLDLGDTVRRRVRRSRRVAGPPLATRYAILGLALGVAAVSRTPYFTALSPIRLAVEAFAFGSTAGLAIVFGLLVFEQFVPRAWCRHACPLGALYAIAGRFAPWRVRIDPALAGRTPCSLCTMHCTMGIPVMERYSLKGASAVTDPDCTRCGACIDACPSGVLRFWPRRDRETAT